MIEQSGARPGPRRGDSWLPAGDGEFLMTGREWAADVLATIAEFAEGGAWPDQITIADAARALRRAMSNAERLPLPNPAPLTDADEPALIEFVRGWRDAQTCGACPFVTSGSGAWPPPDDHRCHEGITTCARVRSGPSVPPSR